MFFDELAERLNDVSQSDIEDEPVVDVGKFLPWENIKKADADMVNAWAVEAEAVDRSIRILPGVKRMIESIPDGRYAVATSGAKTYGKHKLL